MRYPTSNKTVIILLLGSLTAVSPFAIDMYLPAFSQIARDLSTTPARLSLSLASYFFGLAAGQLLYGPLLDRFGRRIPLYCGLIVFVVACIGCMKSSTVETLVAFRFIQALGGCAAAVAAMAMVRDFFPAKESAKIFSMLMLVLGLSPLLAPTLGGFIAVGLGWQAIFIVLGTMVSLVLASVYLFLPAAQPPDKTVSLKAGPILTTFWSILKHPQFRTYSIAGSFSFAALLMYVSGSPVIFMEIFKVTPQVFGGLFALLSVGFIGGNQLNILFLRKFKSEQIFRFALITQVFVSTIFLIGTWNDWYGLTATVTMLFFMLSCIGLTNPNAFALALAPFTSNLGSAAALIGFLQIGVAGIASAAVGFIPSGDRISFVAMLLGAGVISFLILSIGRRGVLKEGSAVGNGLSH
jgi:MFS transporter, DHA1 family, multidrug resistance protein